MADPNLEIQRQVKRLSALRTKTIELLRYWDEKCGQSQKHEHSVTVWIVGLCGGGIAAVGPIINPFLDVKSLTVLQVGFLYGPFLLGIVFGMLHSIILTRLMDNEYKFGLAKYSALDALLFVPVANSEHVQTLRKDLKGIALGGDKNLEGLKKKLHIPFLEACLRYVQHLPMLMFGLGVTIVVVAIVSARGGFMFLSGDWVAP